MLPGILPFRARRFAAGVDLRALTAPPYDAIEPGQDRVLLDVARNIAHLTLVSPADAAATLHAWCADGTLSADDAPSLYLEREEFLHDGRAFTREILHGLVPLGPAAGGAPILFHEETFAPVVDVQAAVLERAGANLDSTLLLYEDEDGAVSRALAPLREAPIVEELRDAAGRRHVVRRCTDPAAVAAVGEALRGRALLIADGHHRMEAALRHASAMGAGSPPARLRQVGLVAADSPGLLLLPTFRILDADPAEGLGAVRREAAALGLPVLPVARAEAERRLAADRAALVALPAGGGPGVLVACRGGSRGAAQFLTRRLLPALERAPEIRRSLPDALALLDDGRHGLALLLSAPRVDDVRVAGDAGLPMPPKSTCFHPKLLSGLLVRLLEDEGR